MKKKGFALLAGVLGASLLLGTACSSPKADAKAPAFENADATLTLSGAIDKSTLSRQVSPDLFGVFLEDINYASYALDDNLIVNSSFEYKKNKLYGWEADGVSLSATTAESLFRGKAEFGGVNPTCAEIKASSPNGSITNSGYAPVPIAVKEGTEYTFSAFIKASDYQGEIGIAIVKGSEKYAEGSIDVDRSDDWVKYSATITAIKDGNEGLELQLTFPKAGTLYLDGVLFETNDATGGFKNYLYKAIEELSPAFIRFPGGCIIEGRDYESAYDWKNSVGATTVAGSDTADTVPEFSYTHVKDGKIVQERTRGEQVTRTSNTDLWQSGDNYYEMEYGIGFYEYFMLCDRLGAKAVPIVNCGYLCMARGGGQLKGRHGNKVRDYIQDAKDLICFAKGSVNSSDPNEKYWAQLRADMGHPAPFEMDYIGIGNEQWGIYYTEYYEKFLEDFRIAAEQNPIYASVRPVVGNCTMFVHCEDPAIDREGVAQIAAKTYLSKGKIYSYAEYGLVDQHYYMNYTDFLLAATDDVYAGYTRPSDGTEGYTQNDEKYYEVFVGEYAANNADAVQYPSENKNNKFRFEFNGWLSALSEAALMTTFESNGDIVRLAAYAPMFASLNASDNQWAVDMMFYNNTDVVLTSNYYVQQLFMKNAGDYKIDAKAEFASGSVPQTGIKASNNASFVRTVNDIYYVASADEETGDIIVKIVNASANEYDFNISLDGLNGKIKDFATVTVLDGAEPDATSTLAKPVVTPVTYSIGGFTKKTFGYTVTPYSVSAIRVKTK